MHALIGLPILGMSSHWYKCSAEFIRVPTNAQEPSNMAKGLARKYSGWELGSMPLAAQVMGSYLPVMERIVPMLLARGAPRIDLNCGCPASAVTGKGAGSRYTQSCARFPCLHTPLLF